MKLKALFLGISLITIPSFTFSAEEESSIFDEVVVTARKREETSQSVPIPITALGGDQLEARNITEIQDITKLTPNLSFEAQGINSTVTSVFLRGIGQTNWSETQDPKIGIYIDGVYLSRAQGGMVDLIDVERIEVLRGPQGTLFGRNTTAGLIHIITKDPTEALEGFANVGVGTEGHVVMRGVLNVPMGDKLSARFAVMSKETDGFIKNQITGKDQGNEDSQSFRASFKYTGDAYKARLTFDHFESDELATLSSCRFIAPENGAVATGFPAVAFLAGTYDTMRKNCQETSRYLGRDNNPNQGATTDTDSFTLTQSLDLGIGTLTMISNHREIENYNGTWGWGMGSGNSPTTTTTNLLDVINYEQEFDVDSHEIRLSGDTDNLSWTIGAYTFEEDNYGITDVPVLGGFTPPAPTAWPMFYMVIPGVLNVAQTVMGTQMFGSRTQYNIVTNSNDAFFAEGTYVINDKTDITVGVRRTEDDRKYTRGQYLYAGDNGNNVKGPFDPGNNCPGNIDPTTMMAKSETCYKEVDYSETTSRVIVSHATTENVMTYASYSKGYSSGGFNQAIDMKAFLPEVSDNYEVGFKGTFRDGTMRLNGTYFHNIYENQQITVGRVIDGQPTADIINAEEAKIQGLELELLAQLSDSWAMTMTYGLMDGMYNSFTVDDYSYDPTTFVTSITTRDLSDTPFGYSGDNGKSHTFDMSFIHTQSLSSGANVVSQL
ncbi:MAG: hypothetical protein CMD53_03315, partial [Gammaproteobacteria bacterium]|nr:hypothetical protein [Gammaproteobacteria bacterium]